MGATSLPGGMEAGPDRAEEELVTAGTMATPAPAPRGKPSGIPPTLAAGSPAAPPAVFATGRGDAAMPDPTAPARGAKAPPSRRGIWIVALAVATGAGVAGALLLSRRPADSPIGADSGASVLDRDARTPDATPRPADASRLALAADVGRALVDAARLGGRPPVQKKRARPITDEQGGREGRILTDPDLQAAWAALQQNEFDKALRLCQRALYKYKDDPRASSLIYAAMAAAYCGKRDLGNAQGMLRRVLPAHQRRVRQFCIRFGQQLGL
jgi:hypothetical protein